MTEQKRDIQKIYKSKKPEDTNMNPGDLKGSPDESFSNETFVFIDGGFLSKISQKFGEGKYLKYDILNLAKELCKKEMLFCKNVYYYTAPPFQSPNPTKEESNRHRNYEKFKNKLKEKKIIIREGVCQRLKTEGKFVYGQKGVDILLTLDMTGVPQDNKNIRKLILIASDSDFVPLVKKLRGKNIKTILYTYFNKKNRQSRFSTSNELIKSSHKYVLLTKQDFENSKL